jgi:hypothetical protein
MRVAEARRFVFGPANTRWFHQIPPAARWTFARVRQGGRLDARDGEHGARSVLHRQSAALRERPQHLPGRKGRADGGSRLRHKRGGGAPIAGATVDAWQTNEEGFYGVRQKGVQPEMNLRGVFTTNDSGEYWFRSAKPRWYPIPGDGPAGAMLNGMGRSNIRPAHVHFIVRATGYEDVVTHVFPPDCPYLDTDAVFGVKESLIGEFQLSDDKTVAERLGFSTPFWTLNWDFALAAAR